MKKILLFTAISTMVLCGCNQQSKSPTSEEIQQMIAEAKEEAKAEAKAEFEAQGNSSNSSYSLSSSSESSYSSSSEDVHQSVYKYEFVVSNTTYRLTLDPEEESAQLYVQGQYAPDGKTFYGTCRREYGKKHIIQSNGFSGAGDFDITIRGEKTWWNSYQYIDTKNNFLYLKHDHYKAKNPDYRFALTPVK